MKVAYIVGPYRARTVFGRMLNIYRARKVAIEYWQKGYVVICPHTNSAFFDGKAADDIFLRGYLELIRRVDVLIILPGWLKSTGSKGEHKLATKLRKQTIYHSPVV